MTDPGKTLGRSRIFVGLMLLTALTLGLVLWGCHGSRVPAELAPNHATTFDFSDPPCEAARRPAAGPDDVLIRYLGTGGLYLEWRGEALLTAPFFSNHGLGRAAFGQVGWDDRAIRLGLAGVPLDRVRAVLAGHSHYDHLGDLPPILIEQIPQAELWVNRSGAHMLHPFEELRDRMHVLEETEGQWIRPATDDGTPWPLRFRAIPSGHAPHVRGIHLADGEVEDPWPRWEGRRLLAMREGRTYAFLIDFLDGDTVRFRIQYQDAASPAPRGIPSPDELDGREADLVIACLPGSWLVRGYPETLIGAVDARHVMVTHYEDFFRSQTLPLRFVIGLSDRRARSFLERVRSAVAANSSEARGPDPCGCGPCGDAWSMPLPGEWLRFSTSPREPADD